MLGFFLLSTQIFDFIEGDESIFEVDILPQLTADRQLMCRFHDGFGNRWIRLRTGMNWRNFGRKVKLLGKFGEVFVNLTRK